MSNGWAFKDRIRGSGFTPSLWKALWTKTADHCPHVALEAAIAEKENGSDKVPQDINI